MSSDREAFSEASQTLEAYNYVPRRRADGDFNNQEACPGRIIYAHGFGHIVFFFYCLASV